ncbi:ATP-dependent DNA ligase [Cellulomonas soli]|nr:DNA ligase [Cellulomonas soli]
MLATPAPTAPPTRARAASNAAPGPEGLPGGFPGGPEWAFEVKWDGVRVLADTRTGQLHLTGRTGADVTVAYPELAGLGTVQGALLDGEVVLLHQGTPSFAALAARMHVRDGARARALADRAPVTYLVFDVLSLYGVDLHRRPWHERRATLERLTLPAHVQASPVYDDGAALWEATDAQGLEGVLAKRRDAAYQPGRRSPDWVKAAHRRTRTALVAGWREESTGHGTLAAVLLAAPDADGALRYLGRAGSGLSATTATDLRRILTAHPADASPLDDTVPAADALGTHWCTPGLLVDVLYLNRTPVGRLRQPVVRGVRTDVPVDPWERP